MGFQKMHSWNAYIDTYFKVIDLLKNVIMYKKFSNAFLEMIIDKYFCHFSPIKLK